MTMDAAGNLYGSISFGPPEVFRLTQQNGQWTQTGLNGQDGEAPYGSVILDASGNIYTTASFGGGYSAGVIFEVTP